MFDSHEKGEDDEVLQTKIISLLDVSRDWNDWFPAVEAEVTSLLEEKETFKEVSGEKLEELLKYAEKRGIPVEFLPSKLAGTKKPGKKGGHVLQISHLPIFCSCFFPTQAEHNPEKEQLQGARETETLQGARETETEETCAKRFTSTTFPQHSSHLQGLTLRGQGSEGGGLWGHWGIGAWVHKVII